MKKYPWKIDVAVLLIFFVRADTFQKVFDSVKKARPRTLLLWQDGPRANRADDISGIKRCREIVEAIDWECEIHTHYCEENYGCDPSTFYADQWAFSIVDKCIILEDDQCPSQSFFYFCKELLDKYENDTRISHICGYNTFGTAKWCNSDYLFAYTGTGAWASWKRVADNWDEKYSFLNHNQIVEQIQKVYGKRSRMWLEYAKRHKKSGVAHWESIIGMGAHLQSQYVIIPKYNLVKNYGISQNATHSSVDDLALIPQKDRAFYTNDAMEIEFPLKSPETILIDIEYDRRRTAENNPTKWKRFTRNYEYVVNLLRHGRFDIIKKKIRGK